MRDLILKRILTILLPFIQMYGLYVIFHGHLSPGGGFAGGMIVGLGFIGFATVFGLERGSDKLPHRMTTMAESFGTLWYGAIGLVGILRGTSFLMNKQAGVLVGQAGDLFSGGLVFLITLGIGVKVASTMVTLFFALTEEEN